MRSIDHIPFGVAGTCNGAIIRAGRRLLPRRFRFSLSCRLTRYRRLFPQPCARSVAMIWYSVHRELFIRVLPGGKLCLLPVLRFERATHVTRVFVMDQGNVVGPVSPTKPDKLSDLRKGRAILMRDLPPALRRIGRAALGYPRSIRLSRE